MAGKIARDVLDTVLAAVRPGITTDALDRIAHLRTIELGAYPSPLNYLKKVSLILLYMFP